MAGNGVVIKPDAQTPFSTLWAAEPARGGRPAARPRCGVVTGRGAELGEPLIDAVDYLMFTGSTATGGKVAAQAAAALIDCSMELGGKNPLLVLADASLRRAVPGAVRGVTSSSGQLCISIERIYVHDAVYDDVHGAPRRGADAACRLGSSLTFDEDMGSLVSADQLAKVEAARRRRGRAREPRCWRAARHAPTSAPTSTSRRCWPASPRRWSSAAPRPSDPSRPCTAAPPWTR